MSEPLRHRQLHCADVLLGSGAHLLRARWSSTRWLASETPSASQTSYKASRAAVNPAATTAGLATVVGKAQLVDGKKNNKASLHVRNPRSRHCL